MGPDNSTIYEVAARVTRDGWNGAEVATVQGSEGWWVVALQPGEVVTQEGQIVGYSFEGVVYRDLTPALALAAVLAEARAARDAFANRDNAGKPTNEKE